MFAAVKPKAMDVQTIESLGVLGDDTADEVHLKAMADGRDDKLGTGRVKGLIKGSPCSLAQSGDPPLAGGMRVASGVVRNVPRTQRTGWDKKGAARFPSRAPSPVG